MTRPDPERWVRDHYGEEESLPPARRSRRRGLWVEVAWWIAGLSVIGLLLVAIL